MKRTYEAAVVFDGALPDEQYAKEQERVQKFIEKSATFDRIDTWGRKDFAYPITGKKTGNYCFFIYQGEGDFNDKLDKFCRMEPKIIRHMIVLYEKTPEISPKEIVRDQSEDVEGEE